MNDLDMLWNASQEELKNGYVETDDGYVCLLCGHKVEKGLIYPEEGLFYEAGRYIRIHIQKTHGSVFDALVHLDKRYTGLTDHQNNLLQLFYQGKSDEEVKREMGIGSSATIRNHRFGLKEKERQAKVFLALMELLKEKDRKTVAAELVLPHHAAKMVDDRYHITEEENEKILRKYFTHGLNGPITTFDMKEKSKLAVLRQIAKRFEIDRTYSEKEVNEILKGVHEDYVTLRRYLIEYGFMDREPSGSRYWLIDKEPGAGDETMDAKKEMKLQYKEIKTQAGVYQIKNLKNGKIYLESTNNLKTMNGKPLQLNGGGHRNKQLQEEWKQFGEKAFSFEILEVLEEKQSVEFDRPEELKKLEAKWLKKLQPYGERGYNKLKQ